jgi:hypothetical protein
MAVNPAHDLGEKILYRSGRAETAIQAMKSGSRQLNDGARYTLMKQIFIVCASWYLDTG